MWNQTMWNYKDNSVNTTPAGASPSGITWREAWLMVAEAVRPYPDGGKAVLEVVNRLLAECDAAGDSPARPEFLNDRGR